MDTELDNCPMNNKFDEWGHLGRPDVFLLQRKIWLYIFWTFFINDWRLVKVVSQQINIIHTYVKGERLLDWISSFATSRIMSASPPIMTKGGLRYPQGGPPPNIWKISIRGVVFHENTFSKSKFRSKGELFWAPPNLTLNCAYDGLNCTEYWRNIAFDN